MAEGKGIQILTEENFTQKTAAGAVLVDFSAEWCGPCRMMGPVLEKVAQELTGKVVVAKIDIDEAQKVAAQFQITSVPTLILFRDGKEAGRLVGLRDQKAIHDFAVSN